MIPDHVSHDMRTLDTPEARAYADRYLSAMNEVLRHSPVYKFDPSPAVSGFQWERRW